MANAEPIDDDTKRTLREIAAGYNDLRSEIERLTDDLQRSAERIDELETRLNDHERTNRIHETRIDTLDSAVDRLWIGLSDLQANALRSGEILSGDGVQTVTLTELLGVEIRELYDGAAIVAADTEDEDTGRSRVPDDLIEVERERWLIHGGLKSIEELETYPARAVHVWTLYEKACIERGDYWILPSSTVRRQLREFCGDDVSEDSLPMVTSRVMETLARMSGGVLRTTKRDDGAKILVGDKEEIRSAKQPAHRTTTDATGNTVIVSE